MLDGEVLEYIRKRGLWTMAYKLTTLTAAIEQNKEDEELYIERGKCYFRQQAWGSAINDFRRALELNPENREAAQFIEMTQEILEFRYTDIYNP